MGLTYEQGQIISALVETMKYASFEKREAVRTSGKYNAEVIVENSMGIASVKSLPAESRELVRKGLLHYLSD